MARGKKKSDPSLKGRTVFSTEENVDVSGPQPVQVKSGLPDWVPANSKPSDVMSKKSFEHKMQQWKPMKNPTTPGEFKVRNKI